MLRKWERSLHSQSPPAPSKAMECESRGGHTNGKARQQVRIKVGGSSQQQKATINRQ
jgi:hypothetical protein